MCVHQGQQGTKKVGWVGGLLYVCPFPFNSPQTSSPMMQNSDTHTHSLIKTSWWAGQHFRLPLLLRDSQPPGTLQRSTAPIAQSARLIGMEKSVHNICQVDKIGSVGQWKEHVKKDRLTCSIGVRFPLTSSVPIGQQNTLKKR